MSTLLSAMRDCADDFLATVRLDETKLRMIKFTQPLIAISMFAAI